MNLVAGMIIIMSDLYTLLIIVIVIVTYLTAQQIMLIIHSSIAMIWIVFFNQGNFFLCFIQVTLGQEKNILFNLIQSVKINMNEFVKKYLFMEYGRDPQFFSWIIKQIHGWIF